ncbi:MAG: hypothetical protein WC510_05330 [Candidatus Omnitrophota bacterium]
MGPGNHSARVFYLPRHPHDEWRGKEKKMNFQRVVTFLNRDEVDFLDKIGKDALFSTGAKISRAKIIAWLVEFMEHLNVNGEGIRTEGDLENRVKRILEEKARLPR